MTMSEATKVEVVLCCADEKESTVLSAALAIYLEECGQNGEEFFFNTVNVLGFGTWNQVSGLLLCFIGDNSLPSEQVKACVEDFLDSFTSDLQDKDLQEEWLEDLNVDVLPDCEGYSILNTSLYLP
jgi:hypothetical protein